MRVAEYLDRAASISPGTVGFIDPFGETTFAEATRLTHKIARALIDDQNVSDISKVAVYSPNTTQAYLTVLGINRCDYVWVPLNYRNSLETNIQLMQFLDVDYLFYHSDFEHEIAQITKEVSTIRGFVCLDAESPHGPSLEEYTLGKDEIVVLPPEDPNRTVMVIATGGTTGPSKGVEHTHRTYEMCICNFNGSMQIPRGARHLIIAPLTHTTGFLAGCYIAAEGCNIIHSGFDATEVLETIEKQRITHLFLPPTAFYALLDHPDAKTRDLSSLQRLTLGAAPCSAEKFRRGIELFGPCMSEAFGQMETLFPMLIKLSADYLNDDGSIDEDVMKSTGRPGLVSRVEIMGDNGEILAPGERGEMVIRCSSVMKGYYKNPQATAEVSTHNWHHTGDVAVKDERGYIRIVDRKKDMIITGGFNVYPVEVEAVLNALPEIENCAVIGVPDDKWGEAVKAVIKLRANASLTEEKVISECKEKLGSVKTPKTIEFWEDLPLSPVGKVLKRDIRKRFWGERERAI